MVKPPSKGMKEGSLRGLLGYLQGVFTMPHRSPTSPQHIGAAVTDSGLRPRFLYRIGEGGGVPEATMLASGAWGIEHQEPSSVPHRCSPYGPKGHLSIRFVHSGSVCRILALIGFFGPLLGCSGDFTKWANYEAWYSIRTVWGYQLDLLSQLSMQAA